MLQSEIYKQVAHELGVPLERVIEYDKQMWNFIKLNLNNPTFDTFEISFFGSFNITKVKIGRTLRQSIIILKRMKKKIANTKRKSKWDENTQIKYNAHIEN